MIENLQALRRHTIVMVLTALILGDVALLLWGPRPADHQVAITTALAAGAKPDWWHDATLGIHYGAWIGLAGWILLAITHRIWTRAWDKSQPATSKVPSPR